VVLFPASCKGAGNITFPCPPGTDGTAKCHAQAHKDAATRQNPSSAERTCDADKNTFGCAFYSRIADLEKTTKAAAPPKKPTLTTLHLGIFNDGTGNNLELDMKTDSVSNIGKLYQLYPQTIEADQLWDKHYVHGIGTDGSYDGLKQGFAVGFDERIEDSLKWLERMAGQHPDAELKLHIFGFSRGAAEARALVNRMFEDDHRAKFGLSKSKIEIEVLALFDTVGSTGLPGNGFDLGYDLTVHADRVTKVIHLIAQSEVRSNFDLWSIRCHPGIHSDLRVEQWVKTRAESMSVAPEDWEEVRGRAPMPNPKWEEWILPGMHADVGGGYGPDEWIPDLPTPAPHEGEPLNDYVYRILDERLNQGGTPRGLVSNSSESEDTLKARVKKFHEERYRRELAEFERVRQEARATGQPSSIPERLQSKPVLRIPKIRQLNNDLSRLALEVMRQRTTAAKVRWLAVTEVRPEVRKWFQPLPPEHVLLKFLEYSKNMDMFESTLQVGLDPFKQVISEYAHDSRWLLDLPNRKRDVYFGGRKS
jgi:hypothetical protein